jgi:hypothetical protein
MPDLQNLPFDIVVFLLRIVFVFFLYFFLFQIVRVLSRDLRTVKPPEATPSPYGRAVIVEPGSMQIAPGVSYQLQPITSLGRKLSNTIVLDDNFVSGEHTLLTWRDGRWWVEDVASTNGTFVNGAEVTRPTPLLDGDVIGVGGVQLKIVKS